MRNARMMYLRPGNLFKDFIVEQPVTKVTDGGRVVTADFDTAHPVIIHGCLSEASEKDITNHSIENHTVTHTIVQRGAPKAAEHQKLIMDGRVFYITYVDDAGGLGISTIYYAEERKDAK